MSFTLSVFNIKAWNWLFRYSSCLILFPILSLHYFTYFLSSSKTFSPIEIFYINYLVKSEVSSALLLQVSITFNNNTSSNCLVTVYFWWRGITPNVICFDFLPTTWAWITMAGFFRSISTPSGLSLIWSITYWKFSKFSDNFSPSAKDYKTVW